MTLITSKYAVSTDVAPRLSTDCTHCLAGDSRV